MRALQMVALALAALLAPLRSLAVQVVVLRQASEEGASRRLHKRKKHLVVSQTLSEAGLELASWKSDKSLLEVDVDLNKSQAEADRESNLDVLTPEERLAAHAEKYEKDFTIGLDMTVAHDTGVAIGAQLNIDTDFQPVSILKIHKNGLLEQWNRDNPNDQVLVGDEISRVNDILWHHNSQTFAQRIAAQFHAAREFREGAKRVLTLEIHRPRKEQETRYSLQREDLHRQLYAKEFTANVTVKSNKEMGWELNSSVDWLPVSISKIRFDGVLERWNVRHPESRILVGDEIIQVNSIGWHHNSKTFEGRIGQQLAKAQRATDPGDMLLSLRIQRPRAVDEGETLENKTFMQEFPVELQWNESGLPVGLELNASWLGVKVQDIQNGSMVALWNARNPTNRILVGDRIDKVNGIRFAHNPQVFKAVLSKAVEASQAAGTRAKPLLLHLKRRVTFAYEKGWPIELQCKENGSIGWQLNSKEGELPVTVSKVRAVGSVAKWNQENPEDAVEAGDQIFSVGDVRWHENSPEFVSQINHACSNGSAAGAPTLRLWVQRPLNGEDEADPASGGELEEFLVELAVPASASEGEAGTLTRVMGWQLNSTEGVPVSIEKIRTSGALQAWNDENPDVEIQPGDQIIRVNHLVWHNNTKSFEDHLKSILRRSREASKNVSMLLRRPKRDFAADGMASDPGANANAPAADDAVGGGDDDVIGAED